jgi:hypothetical protein
VTNEDWKTCDDIGWMLGVIKLSPRKQRLFSVAVCRHYIHMLDNDLEPILKELELHADGKWEDMQSTNNSAHFLAQSTTHHSAWWVYTAVYYASCTPVDLVEICWLCSMSQSLFDGTFQCDLLRHMHRRTPCSILKNST